MKNHKNVKKKKTVRLNFSFLKNGVELHISFGESRFCGFGVSAILGCLRRIVCTKKRIVYSILGLLHLGLSLEIFKKEDFWASAAGKF